MYVNITGSSNNKDIYIYQSYRKENGKTSSRIFKKLGKYNELLERFDNDKEKLMAWAKEEARKETEAYNNKAVPIPLKLSQKAFITKDEERCFNVGYLFLQQLCTDLRIDNICRKINQSGDGILSEETAYLVERSLDLYEATDGAFDIAIYPVMKACGFTDDNFRVPDADELKDLLTLTDASDISYDKETSQIAFKKDGMQIDFGGIAKGYTSARIMDIFRACGIKSGLVNLGGNVQALGTKKDGSSWRVAVQDPQDTDQYLGVLSIQDKAVITSGGYERYFEQDGRTYHHIIDPKTGYPVENGLISVSIVTADGTLADGLSTSVFIMGKEAATEYWRNHSDEFDMILMTDDREIYVTEGIADSFESEMDTKIIEKKV